MTRRHRAGGFTLLELIAASAIMAALALTMYTAMRVGFRARDRVFAAVGPARAGEIAMDLVRRDLESALPPTGLLAQTFIGQAGLDVPEASSVTFYAMGREPLETTLSPGYGTSTSTMSRSQQNARLDPTAGRCAQKIELTLRPSAGGNSGGNTGGRFVLVRRVQRNALAATEEVPEEQVLCRDVTAFHVRYHDGSQWHEEWDSTQFGDTVPLAVEVSLELIRPSDPTKPMTDPATDPSNVATYRATRMFVLPCRNEQVLLEGVAP